MRKTHLISAACALATIAAVAGAATPVSASSKSSVLYNSTISPLPANLPSLGFQATQTAEFGNQIKLTTGGDPNPGKVFWNTETASYYCDGGTAGVGVFRLDSPGTSPSDACWTVGSTPGVAPYYFPVVQFNG